MGASCHVYTYVHTCTCISHLQFFSAILQLETTAESGLKQSFVRCIYAVQNLLTGSTLYA